MSKARDIASAAPAPSTVSATELGYVDGVTSAIQTQLDAKTAKSTLTTTGDIYYASAANTPARLGIGSTDQVLKVTGGIPAWATASSGALTLITPTSTANSGGSVSTSGGAVTFTGVTSVSLNGVFTSTYTNYLIITDSIIGSGNADLSIRMRASGTDTTANYEIMLFDKPFNTNVSAPVSLGTQALGTTNWYMSDTTNTLGYNFNNFILSSPQKTISTTFHGTAVSRSGYQSMCGKLSNSTSYDGFTLTASANNVDGIIRVYGYSK